MFSISDFQSREEGDGGAGALRFKGCILRIRNLRHRSGPNPTLLLLLQKRRDESQKQTPDSV